MNKFIIPTNPGCILDTPDSRDYIIEDILGAPAKFSWDKGFDIEKEIGQKLKVETQGSSSSCVAQAFSKYLEVLEIVDKSFTDLSAKDIYSRIYIPPRGGARLRDGAKLAVSRGVATEISNPSYMNGKPPTEKFMREKIEGLEAEAKKFQSKSYATTTHNSIDFFASYIRDHHGLVSGVLGDNDGWHSAFVKPPKTIKWGHGIYFGRARLINGKKYLGFLNSWSKNWGNDGWGWLDEDYFGTVKYKNILFNLWALLDIKQTNKNNMLKIIGDKKTKQQYLLGKDNVLRWIFNTTLLEQIHSAGIADKNKVEWKDDLSRYIMGKPIAIIDDDTH